VSELRFELKVWNTIIAIAFVIILGVWKYNASRQAIDEQAAEVIKVWLSSEYSSHHQATLDDYSIPASERAELLKALHNIRFKSLSAHGSSSNMVVRIEIEPGPTIPPNADRIRYFDVSYSAAFDKLKYERDSNAFSYYMAMFTL